jgi:ATP-dependent Lon protease
VLPVGGIKEKILAAHRAGLRRVIMARRNEPDLEDIPSEVHQALTFVFVDTVAEVLAEALEAAPARDGAVRPARRARNGARARTAAAARPA